MNTEERKARVQKLLKEYPDFPKQGVLFRDIFPITRNPEVFSDLINLLVEHIQSELSALDAIVGLESRGFIFAPLLAQKLNTSFVPIRKKGKLPGKCLKVEFDLEYGKDTFEMQQDAVTAGQKIIIVDDLLATGGTLSAAVQLLNKVQANICECIVVIELQDLKGRDKVNAQVFSLFQF